MEFSPLFARVRTKASWCRREVLQLTLDLALEIAREGLEGRPLGALFTIGHSDEVLDHSRPLILDPLQGHAAEARQVADLRLRGTVKELAQLDGAFIVADDGTVGAACRYLEVSAEGVDIPLGLGTRHLAAASVSKQLDVIAIVVSQTGVTRVFCQGELLAEIPAASSHADDVAEGPTCRHRRVRAVGTIAV